MTTLTLVSFLIWSPGLILPHYPQPPMYTTSSPSPRDTTGITSKNNERTFHGKKCALQLETHTHAHTHSRPGPINQGAREKNESGQRPIFHCPCCIKTKESFPYLGSPSQPKQWDPIGGKGEEGELQGRGHFRHSWKKGFPQLCSSGPDWSEM